MELNITEGDIEEYIKDDSFCNTLLQIINHKGTIHLDEESAITEEKELKRKINEWKARYNFL